MTTEEIKKVRDAIELLNGLTDSELQKIEFPQRIEFSQRETDKTLNVKVSEILKVLGIPPHLKGYECLILAISKVVEDRQKYAKITKVLYPSIAKSLNLTPSQVERSIRNIITTGRKIGNPVAWKKFFGHSSYIDKNRRPTNSYFIFQVAEYLKYNS